MNLLKSLFHNFGVLLVGLGIACIVTRLDWLLRIRDFRSHGATISGCLLLSLGFFLRVWATYAFYEHQMRVISLSPQAFLITSGAYRFTRNPLYLGGNVFIFFRAASLLGSAHCHCSDRASSPVCRSHDPARGKAIGGNFWRPMVTIQAARPPLALGGTKARSYVASRCQEVVELASRDFEGESS
jgi:hypothetical protein